ncbi:helix-turn-helix domain-containing protein [Corynebacterium sp. H127]|uniref:helix-turn-helix domain-containing protein n=1 Tax=Corynebacterium sp. H127 TaxID=3133418 RepID=UPI0030A69EC3
MQIDYLTLREVADLLGVSVPTAAKMRDAGELPESVRLGRREVFPRHRMIVWLESNGLVESEAA